MERYLRIADLFTSEGHSKSLFASITPAVSSLHKEQALKTPKGQRSTASMKMQSTSHDHHVPAQIPIVQDLESAIVRHVVTGLPNLQKFPISRFPFVGNFHVFNPQGCWVSLSAAPANVPALASTYRDQIISVFDSLATPVPLKGYSSVSRGAALAWLRGLTGNFSHNALAAAVFDRWNVRSSRTLDPWGLRVSEFGNFLAEVLPKVASMDAIDRKSPENFLAHLDVTSFSLAEWSSLSLFEPEVQLWMLAYGNLFAKIFAIYFNGNEVFSKSQENFIKLLKDLEIIPQLLTTVQATEILRSARGVQANRKPVISPTASSVRKSMKKGVAALSWARKTEKSRKTLLEGSAVPAFEPEPEPECLFTVEALTESFAKIPSAYFPMYGNIFQVRLTTLGRLTWFTEFLKRAWLGLYEREISENSNIFALRRVLCVSDFFPDGVRFDGGVCETCAARVTHWGNFCCHSCNRLVRENLDVGKLAPFESIYDNFLKNDKVATFYAELEMRKTTQSSFANTTQ